MRAVFAASRVARVAGASAMGARSFSAAAGKDYKGILDTHFSPAVPRSPKGNNIVVDYAQGCWIYSMDGKKYLDLQTGIGVANTGHCHPRCVRAGKQAAACPPPRAKPPPIPSGVLPIARAAS